MAIEIMNLRIKKKVIFHSYVSLPEGTVVWCSCMMLHDLMEI